MLVTCEKCKQSYDVDETRLSPRGARIKCPSCGNIFLVQPHALEQAVSNAVATTPNNPGSQEPETIWKILHIGLTYTFHDLESLRNWLMGRPSLDDVKIAKGEDEWMELGDYPEVMTTEMITKFFPLGDVPTSKSVARADDESSSSGSSIDTSLRTPSMIGLSSQAPVAISRDLSEPVSLNPKTTRKLQKERIKAEAQQKKLKKKVFITVSVIIVVFVAVIIVVRHLKANNPSAPTAVNAKIEEPVIPAPAAPVQVVEQPAPQQPVPEAKPDLPSKEEIAELAELELQKQLAEADEMVQKKLWPEARTTLEQLAQDMPDQLDVLQMLAKTYRGLNLSDKAAEVDKHIRKIKEDKKKAEQGSLPNDKKNGGKKK